MISFRSNCSERCCAHRCSLHKCVCGDCKTSRKKNDKMVIKLFTFPKPMPSTNINSNLACKGYQLYCLHCCKSLISHQNIVSFLRGILSLHVQCQPSGKLLVLYKTIENKHKCYGDLVRGLSDVERMM